MKKISIITVCLAALLAGLSTQAFCSEDLFSKPKTTISTELYLLANNVWNLNVETALSDRMTMELEGNYWEVFGSDTYHVYMGGVNVHYYPIKSVSAPEGFWFGPGMGYAHHNLASSGVTGTDKTYGSLLFNLRIGYKFMFGSGKNFVIQPHVGFLYLKTLMDDDLETEMNRAGAFTSVGGIDFGLKIGFAF